jgi:hypothetical protein
MKFIWNTWFQPVVSSGPFETFRFRDPFRASLKDEAFFLVPLGVNTLMALSVWRE